MKTLDQIGIEHQTDKASQFSRTYAKPHDYLRHLERFVEPMRYNPIKILEIGVGGGESIQTWLEYFEQAHVWGVDIVCSTNPWNRPIIPHPHPDPANDRYIFSCGDQSKPEFWEKFIQTYGGAWDLVIDDGSHVSSDVVRSFLAMWPHLKSGGIYVVEDLDTCREAAYFFNKYVASAIHPGDEGVTSQLDSIYFAKELAILRKK